MLRIMKGSPSVLLLVCFFKILYFVSALSSSSTAPYCVNLKCTVKNDRRDELVQLLQQNQKLTLLNEDQALQYVFGQDIDNQNTFYIHEQFMDKSAFLFHKNTPHNQNWQAFRKTDPFLHEPEVNFYHGTHPHAPVKRLPITTTPIFCLNVQLCIDPTMRTEFLLVIQENARGSNQDEPLCLEYVWGEDCDTMNTFHFHEQYTGKDGGREGFEAHSKTKHFAAWEAFASKDPFTRTPRVSFYRTLPTD